MNEMAKHAIIRLLDEAKADYRMLVHPPCATSEESARARQHAGAPIDTIGAKALLVVSETGVPDKQMQFTVVVLPGFAKLNSKALKKQFSELRKFRFATPGEMKDSCNLLPGCMPPFGPSVFPAVSMLVIDESLRQCSWLGFNAAAFETSIVVRSQDYFRVTASEARLGRFTTTDSPENCASLGSTIL